MTRHFDYLLIGGGMAADAAARGIRSLDAQGSIALFSSEEVAPYNRPPLSKGLWKKTKLENIWRHTENLDVNLHLGTTITELLPTENTVRDSMGNEFTYKKALLATGAAPIQIPGSPSGVLYYRALDDYLKLRAETERKETFIVIGGGYIGSEIAAALAMHGKKVSMVFLEKGICARIFPEDMAKYLNEMFTEQGVNILAERIIESIRLNETGYEVVSDRGEVFAADTVIAGLGVRPNINLAQSAGLWIERGVRVNEMLQTSVANIFAAGDCIDFYNPTLDAVIRAEHEEHANRSGEQAGRNMAGANEPYTFLPSAYSDLFDLGYEMIGTIDARLPVVADWTTPYKKGVLYMFDHQQLAGILLVNMYGKLDQARSLLADRQKIRPEDVRGRIK